MKSRKILWIVIAAAAVLAVLAVLWLTGVFRTASPDDPGTGTGTGLESDSVQATEPATEPGSGEESSGEPDTEPATEEPTTEEPTTEEPVTEEPASEPVFAFSESPISVTEAEIRDRVLYCSCSFDGEEDMTREDLEALMDLYLALEDLDPEDRYSKVSVTVTNAAGKTVYEDTRKLPVSDPDRLPPEELNLETIRSGIDAQVGAYLFYSCKEVTMRDRDGLPTVDITISSTFSSSVSLLLASGLTEQILLDTMGYYEVGFATIQLVDAYTGEILIWSICHEDWDLALIWLGPRFR